mgnify:CR=1 FL=1
MVSPVVIRGAFANRVFVPEEPLPDVEGRAELIVYAQTTTEPAAGRPSILDVLGKAKRLRSAADMDAQLEEERASWNDA